MSRSPVAEFHRCIPERAYRSLWRGGSASAPPGFGPRHRNPGFELTWIREGVVAFELERLRREELDLAPDRLRRIIAPPQFAEVVAEIDAARAAVQVTFGPAQ